MAVPLPRWATCCKKSYGMAHRGSIVNLFGPVKSLNEFRNVLKGLTYARGPEGFLVYSFIEKVFRCYYPWNFNGVMVFDYCYSCFWNCRI